MKQASQREAAYAKKRQREASLSDADSAKANRYQRFGLYSLLGCFLIPPFAYIALSFSFTTIALFSAFLFVFCFGLVLFFHGHATMIRGYEHNKFFSSLQDHPFIYDGTARTAAWLQLLAAYIIMGFSIIGCLISFTKYFGLW